LKGVVRTRVGYAGGTKKAPTYHSLGDHTETIQLDYDPSQISYRDLLDIFWRNHNPSSRAWSKQYMAAVFYHDDEQKKLAEESRAREASKRKKGIQTKILPFTAFYRAEDYHQKYQLRREKNLLKEFERIYPADGDLVDSTAAARVNGYLGGYGTSVDLKTDLSRLGLSDEGSRYLLRIVEYRNP
jgi:peptide-methionine (S)-S-oxide reductase